MIKNQCFNKVFVVVAASLVLSLGACSPKVNNGGYIREGDIKSQITVGQSTHEDVRNKLGSPSSQSSFGDETWYYVTDRKEAYAFLKPELVEQDVVSIVFDTNGIVSKIGNYKLDDSKDFELVKRTTPTEGHTLGFFEQVLGNVGRFNGPAGKDKTVAPGRRPGT